MHDQTQPPHGGIGQASPQGGETWWPDASRWPDDRASTLEWARFYFHECRLHDLRPTPAQADRDAHSRYLAGEAESHWRWAHGGAEVPADKAAEIRADAQAFADAVRGPIPRLAKRPGPVTDADLVRWFTPSGHGGADAARTRHHPERGVCVRLGDPESRLAQVDVDPRRGGLILGGLADTPGLRAHTPRGGIHVFLRAAPGQEVHHSDGVLQQGVEVRAAGWALLPSGAATPGRVWVARVPPGAPPAAVLARPPRPSTKRAERVLRDGDGEDEAFCQTPAPDPWGERSEVGRTAALLGLELGSGDGRTSVVRALVGMLAAPRGVPEDVLAALMTILAEYGAGRDWSAARLAEESARWRTALTRGPRDAEFAAEVAAAWQQVRDVGPVRKGEQWARASARSMWKTADRRQEGTAGAEDMGHAGDVGERDVGASDPWGDDPPRHDREYARHAPPPGEVLATSSARSDVTATRPLPTPPPAPTADPALAAVQALASEVSAGDADAQRAAINEMRLRKILPTIGEAYPIDSIRRDVASTPVRVEALYPFYDFLTGRREAANDVVGPTEEHVRVGHGYGPAFSSALGGIREGDFKALGAAGAKGGKTHFLGQLVEGLALCTAARILGVPGYANSPIVMPVWVSEMPKEGEILLRMLARQYGFDSAAVADGTAAAEARGIVHMSTAMQGRLTPAQVVTLAVRIVEQASQRTARGTEDDDAMAVVGFACQRVVREIDLGELPNPRGTGRQRVDWRSGPNLIGCIADAVAIYRRELAALAGVAEDKVLPLVLLDPGQRFAGDSENSKAELDSLLGAVVARICRRRSGLGAACVMTSDTTKAAARDLDVARFLSEPSGPKLAADIFAGSQAIMHHCDVIAVCGEDHGDHFRRTQWARVLQGRTGASNECFPFAWEAHTGRFRARKPEALRLVEERGGWGGGGGSSGQRRGGGRSWSPTGGAPPPAVGDHAPRTGKPYAPTYRAYEPADD